MNPSPMRIPGRPARSTLLWLTLIVAAAGCRRQAQRPPERRTELRRAPMNAPAAPRPPADGGLVARRADPAPPAGPAPVWKRTPADRFLCSRFGPNWAGWDVVQAAVSSQRQVRTFDPPFELRVPPGITLSFKLPAESPDGAPIQYELTGAPAGATLAPGSGRVTWKTAGAAGASFAVELAAVSSRGGRATWPMKLSIASLGWQLAWLGGLDGEPYPDCDSRHSSRTVEEGDLDGDGVEDAVYAYEGALSHHLAYGSELLLRRRAPGRPDRAERVDLEKTDFGDFPDLSAMLHLARPSLVTVKGGATLVRFTQVVEGRDEAFVRIDPSGKPRVVGHVAVASPSCGGSPDGHPEPSEKLELETNARGEVEGLRVTGGARPRRYLWNGRTFHRR